MFWQKKKQTIEWPIIIFGLIALGIIISVGILVFRLSAKIGQPGKTLSLNNLPSVEILVTPVVVKENYNQAISDLQNFVSSTAKNNEELFNQVENILLSVRVPAEKRDIHLQTFLQIEKMRNELVKINTTELKKNLLELLDKLVN